VVLGGLNSGVPAHIVEESSSEWLQNLSGTYLDHYFPGWCERDCSLCVYGRVPALQALWLVGWRGSSGYRVRFSYESVLLPCGDYHQDYKEDHGLVAKAPSSSEDDSAPPDRFCGHTPMILPDYYLSVGTMVAYTAMGASRAMQLVDRNTQA